MILFILIFIVLITTIFIKDSVEIISSVWSENPKFAIISILVIFSIMYFFFFEPIKLFYHFLEKGNF